MPAIRAIHLTRVLRTLAAPPGASGVEGRARQEALAMIERDALVQPAFSYRILPVRELRGETVDLGDATLRVPELAAESGELTAVAAATCTLGRALEARVTALFGARRPLLALALDALGNEMLFRVADRAFARIRREARRQGLETGAELNPGDSGIALDQQAALLALADAEQNRITLTAQGMLAPVKSLSFLAPLGRNLSVRSSGRCDHCPSKDRCKTRAHWAH
jgi:hypothetical protein